MAATFNVPLFHSRLVRERVAAIPPGTFERHRAAIQVWLDHLKKGTLDETKETSLHAGFLERVFGDVLGYRTMATAVEGRWDLVSEKSLLGGSADGALCSFGDAQRESGSDEAAQNAVPGVGDTHACGHVCASVR